MAKFYGVIGYGDTVEVEPGIWEDQIVEHEYYGDLIKNTRKLESSGGINDDINIMNNISIVADPYANKNFNNMRYVTFMDTKWKIKNIEVEYPRLIFTLGDVYNG